MGISLLLWTAGALIGISALLVWLELALSVPKYDLHSRNLTEIGQEAHGGAREGETVLECVPRNGGEKNYVSYRRYVATVSDV